MGQTALSSGCFISHEEELVKLAKNKNSAIELSGHTKASLAKILPIVQETNLKVPSVHFACPKGDCEMNLGAKPAQFDYNSNLIEDTFLLAKQFDSQYIIMHAFYLFSDFPSNDIERAKSFEKLPIDLNLNLQQYRRSEQYQQCLQNAVINLKELCFRMKPQFGNQKILIENLNPRYGYGGIMIEDLLKIAEDLDGAVGICLDVGHYALMSKLSNIDHKKEIESIKDFIKSVHVHTNLLGEYCVMHKYGKSDGVDMQEIDIHFPVSATIRKKENQFLVEPYNSLFQDILKGEVSFDGHGIKMEKNIAMLKDWLSCLNEETNMVLEYDSRFVPLEFILSEYWDWLSGNSPLK